MLIEVFGHFQGIRIKNHIAFNLSKLGDALMYLGCLHMPYFFDCGSKGLR